MNILFRQRAPGWNPFGLLVEKSYSFEKFELLSTWAVELSVSDPEECSDLVTPWSRPARPSLWHVFLGEMKCTNTNTHYTNVQIQIHKYKGKNMNTQIQMHKFKYRNTHVLLGKIGHISQCKSNCFGNCCCYTETRFLGGTA